MTTAKKSYLDEKELKRLEEELLIKSNFDFSDVQKNLAFLKGYKTEGNISSQDIAEAIPKSLQDNIFDMTQLLLRGQIQSVRELVHDLRLQGEDEIKLIAVMLGQFRTYLQVKLLSAQGKSEQQIVSSLSDYLGRKVNQFQVRFALRDSRPLSVAFLKKTIKILVETDYQFLFFHNNYSLRYNSLKIKEILQSYYKKIIPNSEDNFKLI